MASFLSWFGVVFLTPTLPEVGGHFKFQLNLGHPQNENRLEGIDNVLFIQSTMGMTSEVYMEKVDVDGSAVLELRMIRAQG